MSFKIVRNDITKMNTEAIVNTANDHPTAGTGCDSAIYKSAGREKLLNYRREHIGFVEEGEVFITPGFDLQAKYIIHAVSPHYQGGGRGEEKKLRACYWKSLKLAKEKGIRSIAFPLISTGGFGYPKEEGMRIAVDEINGFLMHSDMEIFLVVFDEKATGLGEKIYPDLEAYIDHNYVENAEAEEYEGLLPYTDMMARRQSMNSGQLREGPQERNAANAGFDSRMKEEPYWGVETESRAMEPVRDPEPAESGSAESVPDSGAAESEPAEPPFVSPEFRNFMSGAPSRGKWPDTDEDILPNGNFAHGNVQGSAGYREHNEEADPGLDFAELHEGRLEERMKHLPDTYSEYLMYLIQEKNMKNADVYKRAIVDKKIFSKIKNNVNYHPNKLTALCLCVGAKLNLDQSKDLLARAGYALSPCDKTDIIFSYFIENEIYDMIELDIQLEEHGLPCIIT